MFFGAPISLVSRSKMRKRRLLGKQSAQFCDNRAMVFDFSQHSREWAPPTSPPSRSVRAATTPRLGITQVLLSRVPREGNPSLFCKKLDVMETGEMNEDEVVTTQTVAELLTRRL